MLFSCQRGRPNGSLCTGATHVTGRCTWLGHGCVAPYGRSVGRSVGRTDGRTRALHARPPAWTRNYVALGSPLGVVPCPRAGWPGGVPTGTQTGASEGPCQALYVIIGAYVLSAWPKRGRLAQIPPHEASASCSAPTLPSPVRAPPITNPVDQIVNLGQTTPFWPGREHI